MEPLAEITPQQAADALRIDVYTLARYLRQAAQNDFERIATGVGNSARAPWSASEAREEIEKPLRLIESAEECEKAYEQRAGAPR